MSPTFAIRLNALGLYVVAFVLAAAFAAQITLNELPCPLCLLQRMAFALIAVGPMLNVRHGPRPSHYALSLLAAAAGAAFAMRQILLHIVPPDPGYGSAILGYHYYTWAFIGFAVAIVLIGIVMLFDRQFEEPPERRPIGAFAGTAVWLVILLTAANVGSTFLECGLADCPDNPVRYEWLAR
jgi:disulfide bond formation protein DsbB